MGDARTASRHTACPLCGGAAGKPAFPYATVWQGRRFDYVACRGCGCTFATPLPTPAELDRMYAAGDYHDIHYTTLAETDQRRAAFAFLARHVPAGRLLDFGAGNGAFLLAAKQRGYDAEGVEQGESSIALAAANAGVPVRPLEAVEASGARFAVIHLADVLEHLTEPAAILRRLEALLAPGGLFFLEGPIEKQRSLVTGFATTLKAARRRLRLDRDGDFVPYHLTMTDWRAQAHFLQGVMGYTVAAAELYETGWPYAAPVSRSASPGRNLRAVIGNAAIRWAETPLGRRLAFADRFRVIARPRGR